jgi:hypothetical protein
MSDRDAFDTRLGVALRQYATGAPTDVDPHAFARGIAAMAGRRHRATGVGVLRTVPAPVWVVLAAALLIAGLVGALVGGRIIRTDNLTVVPEPTETRPVARELACPSGTNPDEPGPVNQARPPVNTAGGSLEGLRAAFDRKAGKIVAVVEQSVGARIETWTFDVCTNTWARMKPPQEPFLPNGGMVYDAESHLIVAAGEGGSVWAYDLAANSWTEKGMAPANGPFRLVYDPVSGLVIAQANTMNPALMWTYDVETDAWTETRQQDAPVIAPEKGWVGPGDHQLLAYDTAAGRLIAYNDAYNGGVGGWWFFDPRSDVWSVGQTPAPEVKFSPSPNFGTATGGEIAYDEATKQTVILGDGVAIAYNAATNRWATLIGLSAYRGPDGAYRLGHWMVYDPLNQRLVVLGGWVRTNTADGGWVAGDDVLAFDPATKTWTQLLAPSAPYAQGTN